MILHCSRSQVDIGHLSKYAIEKVFMKKLFAGMYEEHQFIR